MRFEDDAGVAGGTVDQDGTARDFAGTRVGAADAGGIVSDFGHVRIGRVIASETPPPTPA